MLTQKIFGKIISKGCAGGGSSARATYTRSRPHPPGEASVLAPAVRRSFRDEIGRDRHRAPLRQDGSINLVLPLDRRRGVALPSSRRDGSPRLQGTEHVGELRGVAQAIAD